MAIMYLEFNSCYPQKLFFQSQHYVYIENFTFFIGASCWETHQLQGEIAKGYWLPFSGPATMAIYGQDKKTEKDAEATNVWLQMMSSLGEEAIAHLISKNKDNTHYGDACDDV